MPKKIGSCKHITKRINSKLAKIKSGIVTFANKTIKHMKNYNKKMNKLRKTLKHPNTQLKRILHLEQQSQHNITKDKHVFITSQCKLIDSIRELKEKVLENNCSHSTLKPIHISNKNIQTMNMVFTPEQQIILYNDLL
jgi:hypothetical protein